MLVICSFVNHNRFYILDVTDFPTAIRTKATQKQISEMLQVPRPTVQRIIQRYRTTGVIKSQRHGHCGRKRKLSTRMESALARSSRIDPTLTARQIQAEVGGSAIDVSLSTVKRTLRRKRRVAHRPLKAPMLTASRKKVRKAWGQQYRSWNVAQWKKVIFSDETMISINSTRPHFVRRGSDSPIHPILYESDVLGCISADGPWPVVAIKGTLNAARYLQTLQTNLHPYLQQCGIINFQFQQDNAPCYKA